MFKYFSIIFTLIFLLTACSAQPADPQVLRLATTTSTENSGLLAEIIPVFEAKEKVRVDVIAVGTGQALALGAAGDVDVILVHARSREDQFVSEGHGLERFDVMYNDFVIVGPTDDPAGISGMALAAEAFSQIAAKQSSFASRGDDSGTNIKEFALWDSAGIFPAASSMDWYNSLGQGMGDTLLFAEETGSYTLTDRGTFLAMKENLPNLVIIVGGVSIDENRDPTLFNPYGVIPINPDKGGINDQLAYQFIEWLTSIETQQTISLFGADIHGQPLFYPNFTEWQAH